MIEAGLARIRRCAIYTRKSTSHLLDREMNSLETQRQICSAYVTSQRHKGWVEIPKRYDDGGKSGVDANRPALSELMRDIEEHLVDVVIIYKVDRLTRSLADFVRLLDVFDRNGIPFVSVSQSFDTSDALGRMIVNVLLTFSQFERELISDRIRDNVRARKRKGEWTGGPPPFGYELTATGLRVVDEEAEIVRLAFREFLEGGTYAAARRAVRAARLVSTIKFTRNGARTGGGPIGGGTIYRILNNPIYVGEIKGHDGNYEGEHEAIIGRETWEAAQALCAARVKPIPHSKQTNHFLAGILWDSWGRRMRLEIEWDRGRPYFYYASSNACWARRERRRQFRSHAARLDQLVIASVADFLCDREKLRAALQDLGIYGDELDSLAANGQAAAARLVSTPAVEHVELFAAILISVELGKEHVTIAFRALELRRFLLWTAGSKFLGRPDDWPWSDARYHLRIAVRAVSRERSPVLNITARNPSEPAAIDRKLVGLIQSARRAQQLVDKEREKSLTQLARTLGWRPSHFSRLIRLNYLAPDIITSIWDGTQPASLTSESLFKAELPLDWSLQRRLLGFTSPEAPAGAIAEAEVRD